MKSKLTRLDCHNKRVFLRADLNVPYKDTLILDDFRLRASLPTIDLIRQKKGKVILATHRGRPRNHEPHLSTRHLHAWLSDHGYTVDFATDLTSAYQKSLVHPERILLLENLRFFSGEQTSNYDFARQLSRLADVYVNDAFGLLHRHDTSVTILPSLFPSESKTIGLRVEKELKKLNPLVETIARPFVVVIGGGKVADKLPMLLALANIADQILVCPALIFTLLKAEHIPIGLSYTEDVAQSLVRTLLTKKDTLTFPSDYLIARDTLEGPQEIVAADQIPSNGIGVAIGPVSVKQFCTQLSRAKNIFFNAAMGFDHYPATQEATKELINCISNTDAYKVIGGGSSSALAHHTGTANRFDLVSTGGGASLAYISGLPLAGLQSLID